jgi:hypothetical protein
LAWRALSDPPASRAIAGIFIVGLLATWKRVRPDPLTLADRIVKGESRKTIALFLGPFTLHTNAILRLKAHLSGAAREPVET